jgi:hypothetical protein
VARLDEVQAATAPAANTSGPGELPALPDTRPAALSGTATESSRFRGAQPGPEGTSLSMPSRQTGQTKPSSVLGDNGAKAKRVPKGPEAGCGSSTATTASSSLPPVSSSGFSLQAGNQSPATALLQNEHSFAVLAAAALPPPAKKWRGKSLIKGGRDECWGADGPPQARQTPRVPQSPLSPSLWPRSPGLAQRSTFLPSKWLGGVPSASPPPPSPSPPSKAGGARHGSPRSSGLRFSPVNTQVRVGPAAGDSTACPARHGCLRSPVIRPLAVKIPHSPRLAAAAAASPRRSPRWGGSSLLNELQAARQL